MSKHKKTADQNHERHDEVPVELLSHPSYQELMKQLDEAEKKGQENWERILRLQAEQDNLLRRAEKNVENAHKYALEKFVMELLPIIDSLELGLEKAPAEVDAKAEAIIEGINLTLKLFYNVLEKFGVQQVNPIDQPFNPEFHQAISMKDDPAVAPGTVVLVMQKGYTLNGRLVRPALVVVAKNS